MSRADLLDTERVAGTGPAGSGRWRPRALRDGDDPDPRFTLANERTFLAWMRTAMGLIAGAVGFEAFGAEIVRPAVQLVLVLGMLAGAAVIAGFAFVRWLGVERAMRMGRSLPVPSLGALVAVLVGGVALALLAVLTIG
ncbi:YidH family protein [Rhodococcus sp. NPDC058532]|uniref:YidH family protein n=1 Tax=Rhodococcus sp. NPDC058532 TaxID=3346540 RepID=UPI00364AEFE1